MDIDWQERIRDLEAAGMQLSEIAQAIGLSAQAVSDIKCGRSKSPRGMAAVRLHGLMPNSAPEHHTKAA